MSLSIVPTSTTNLLQLLLQEQGELSAVDHFSNWHESQSAAVSAYHALMPATPLKSGQQYGFEVDLDACSGCKACVVACHTLNGLEESETWRKVGALSSQSISSLPIVQHVTTACHHCIDPGCLNGCPVQAYEKDPLTGIVRHLDDQCFGCKYCTMMCPYEVPQYSSTLGIVRKCDMCSQRLAVDEAPACVQACPNQAIRIAIVDVHLTMAETTATNAGASLLPTAPPSQITKPTTRYISKRTEWNDNQGTDSLVSSESTSDKAHDGHLPLVVMIVLTQASVGIWVVFASIQWMGLAKASLYAPSMATGIGVVGVHAALLHLGRPWLAYRAFLGWRTSWLSREAIAFGVFMSVATAAIGLRYYSGDNAYISSIRYADTIVALVGVTAVLCTGMIYIATRRELWGYRRTSWDFVLSMVGLGLIGSFETLDGLPSGVLLLGVLCSVAASMPKLIDYRRGNALNARWDNFSVRSGRVLRKDLAKAWSVLWFLHFLSIVIAICIMVAGPKNELLHFKLMTVAVCLSAQLLHRWLYFASVVYRRMPGAST